jgi:hypothetical protein
VIHLGRLGLVMGGQATMAILTVTVYICWRSMTGVLCFPGVSSTCSVGRLERYATDNNRCCCIARRIGHNPACAL